MEIIWDKEKDFDFSETIKPETIKPLPSYDYWRSQEPLDYTLLRNKPTFSAINTPKIWYFTFASTWNITITWIWFKPNLVKFTFCDQVWWMWVWAMTWTYQYAFDINSKTQIQSQCIYIRNSWWSAIWRAVFVSMNADWFTIDITLATTTIYVNYECY
jgi:hypothetical protein